MKNSKKIERETNKFMKDVRSFLEDKNNGVIPAEWLLSLRLLETYYRQFLQCTEELEKLDSVVTTSRYGPTPHPLLKVQTQAAVRLEKMMSELGLSMKAAVKLDVAKPQVETSPLEAFVQSKIEKR